MKATDIVSKEIKKQLSWMYLRTDTYGGLEAPVDPEQFTTWAKNRFSLENESLIIAESFNIIFIKN